VSKNIYYSKNHWWPSPLVIFSVPSHENVVFYPRELAKFRGYTACFVVVAVVAVVACLHVLYSMKQFENLPLQRGTHARMQLDVFYPQELAKRVLYRQRVIEIGKLLHSLLLVNYTVYSLLCCCCCCCCCMFARPLLNETA
jgi:capsule polysaccharide modification protein KpsS